MRSRVRTLTRASQSACGLAISPSARASTWPRRGPDIRWRCRRGPSPRPIKNRRGVVPAQEPHLRAGRPRGQHQRRSHLRALAVSGSEPRLCLAVDLRDLVYRPPPGQEQTVAARRHRPTRNTRPRLGHVFLGSCFVTYSERSSGTWRWPGTPGCSRPATWWPMWGAGRAAGLCAARVRNALRRRGDLVRHNRALGVVSEPVHDGVRMGPATVMATLGFLFARVFSLAIGRGTTPLCPAHLNVVQDFSVIKVLIRSSDCSEGQG